MEDVPGKGVARKSPLLQLRIGQLAQGVVESCSCPIVSAAFHPGHEEFSEGFDGRGKRRCCVRYDGFANECLLMECHNESLLALSSESTPRRDLPSVYTFGHRSAHGMS